MSDFADGCREMIEKGICHSDCCGLVSFPLATFDANAHKIFKQYQKVVVGDVVYAIQEGDLSCVFLDKHRRCLIYACRPPVCRYYGVMDDLPCPHLKANGRPRNEAGRRHTQRQINKDVDGKLRHLFKGRRERDGMQ
jgi:hypothetical protein